MSSITRQHVGKYTYLYESESFWDAAKKRPDNDKVRIGKIDLGTGEPVYAQEYLDKLTSQGESTEGMRLWTKGRGGGTQTGYAVASDMEIARSVIDSVKDFGVVYFFKGIAERIGLLGVLRDAMPDVWQEVFCVACYLVAADKPLMYCGDWAACNNGVDASGVTSQRVSDLLVAFGCTQRNCLYQSWHGLIREREYIALDITSVSSYSKQIGA